MPCYNIDGGIVLNSMERFFSLDFTAIDFDWDDTKEQINFQRHGIRFRTAVKVFFDPYKIGREDLEHPPEMRYDILGMVGKVLFVVCAYYESSNTVRIISARRATVQEKERYLHGEDFNEGY